MTKEQLIDYVKVWGSQITNIKTEIADILTEIEDNEFVYDPQRIYMVLTLARSKLRKYEAEIKRLNDQNTEMKAIDGDLYD